MKKAPDDFGGHEADASRASEEAVRQLRAVLEYQASVDTAHGKARHGRHHSIRNRVLRGPWGIFPACG